jgi:TRAP-type C4-dicarboxylate transport system permease small subunit
MKGLPASMGDWLDGVCRLALYAAVAMLFAIVAATAWDVTLRYFLRQPTEWAVDVVGFLLCGATFLAIPEVARQRAHVAISMLVDTLPVSRRHAVQRLLFLASALACLLGAWICGDEALRQFTSGIRTVGTFTVPKWWLSGVVAFGFAVTGLQFVRQAMIEPTASDAREGAG